MGQLLLASRLASIDRLVEKTISMDVRPRLDHKIVQRTTRFGGPCRCTFPVRVHVIAAERWLSRKNDRWHSNVGAFGRAGDLYSECRANRDTLGRPVGHDFEILSNLLFCI